jgi:predicted PurR-regulated permease PerM
MGPLRVGFTGTIGALIAYGLAQAAIQARSVLVLLVVAMFIALGLSPLVDLLTRRKVKRGLAVVLVFLIVVVVLGLAGFAIVPVFSDQISALVQRSPQILQDLLRNPQVRGLNDRFQVITKAQELLSSGTLVQQLFGGILGAGRVVLGAVFSGVTLLILTLYFLASLPTIKNAIYRLAPASRRARIKALDDQIFRQISAYISGTFVVALIAGVSSFIFLKIIGLGEYALALAVVIALLDIIPLVGATIAAAIICVVAFVHSPGAGIAAVIFYLIYQQLENYVIQPRVFRRAVDIPGAAVVIAALLGGALLGVVGALLAVPVAAAVLLVLREVIQPRLDAS